MTSHLAILVGALLLDRLVGDPHWLWRRLPHPVVWFGKLISLGEGWLNDLAVDEQRRRRRGVLFIMVLVAGVFVFGFILCRLFGTVGIVGIFVEIVLVAILLAQKSLLDHVNAVAKGLCAGGLERGRRAVSMIVGRDPTTLDEAGVSRAAIESLAENFSDGVVAPALWYALLGLPGLLAYKMINTADSMIGHLSDRYRAFGWAAAKLDDVVNWPAARLAACLILLSQPLKLGKNMKLVARDASLHRSPNAGWPEAAMATISGLALGGPRIYVGDVANDPFINDTGRKDAGPQDIERCIGIADRAFFAGVALVAVFFFVAL
ncbi:MAG: adenosylcobinamide-phosphate synthase CbiB [Pseudomonadota bacterium]